MIRITAPHFYTGVVLADDRYGLVRENGDWTRAVRAAPILNYMVGWSKDAMKEPSPAYRATLDDDGSAVIEFEDRSKGFFADLMFRADGIVECYRRETGAPSEFFEGALGSLEAQDFIKRNIHVVF